VQHEHKPPVYIMFSDLTATFGHAVVEGNW
jgi:hypothetical protein